MNMTPSASHTIVQRPAVCHLFAMAVRLGITERIDHDALEAAEQPEQLPLLQTKENA